MGKMLFFKEGKKKKKTLKKISFIFWALLIFGILPRLDLLESIEQVKSKAEILGRAEEKDYEAQLYFLD